MAWGWSMVAAIVAAHRGSVEILPGARGLTIRIALERMR